MRYRGLGAACGLALLAAACAGDPTGMAACTTAGFIDMEIQVINAARPLPAKFMQDEQLIMVAVRAACLSPVTNAATINANVTTLQGMRDQARSPAPIVTSSAQMPTKVPVPTPRP